MFAPESFNLAGFSVARDLVLRQYLTHLFLPCSAGFSFLTRFGVYVWLG